MAEVGKFLLVTGALIALVGVALLLFPHLPLVGRLPGDLRWRTGNVVIYVPLASSILLSLLLTLLLNLFFRR